MRTLRKLYGLLNESFKRIFLPALLLTNNRLHAFFGIFFMLGCLYRTGFFFIFFQIIFHKDIDVL